MNPMGRRNMQCKTCIKKHQMWTENRLPSKRVDFFHIFFFSAFSNFKMKVYNFSHFIAQILTVAGSLIELLFQNKFQMDRIHVLRWKLKKSNYLQLIFQSNYTNFALTVRPTSFKSNNKMLSVLTVNPFLPSLADSISI